MASPRRGRTGGNRRRPIRCSRPWLPSARRGGLILSTTDRRPGCCACTWRRSGQRASPKLARSGSAGKAGCSAPSGKQAPPRWQTEKMSAPALPVAHPADPDTAGQLHEPCVLLKLGEIVLKGRNRQQFERLLHDNIRRAVRDLGIEVRVWQREGVIVVRVAGADRGGLGAETAVDLVA